MSLETNHRLVAGRRHRKSINQFRPLKIDDLIDSFSTSKNRLIRSSYISLGRVLWDATSRGLCGRVGPPLTNIRAAWANCERAGSR